MIYDVIVAGMGPAGSTAGYYLSKAGLKVLALEKEKLPRYKPCGGGLTTKTVEALDFGVSELFLDTIHGGIFTFKDKALKLMCDMPYAYTVNRREFDYFLTGKAKEAGAKIIDEERMTKIGKKDSHILVETVRGTYEGKYLLGADGVNSVAANFLYPKVKRKILAALESDVKAPADRIETLRGLFQIDFGSIPLGYSWIFPKKNYFSIGSAGMGKSAKKIKEFYKQFIDAQKILNGIEIDKAHGCTLPMPYSQNVKLAKDRVFLLGDAGCLVNPFTGEGIYFAVESGKTAAGTLINHWDNPKAESLYDKAIKEKFYFEFKWAHRLMRLVNAFPGLSYQIICDHKEVMHVYFELLRGTLTYEQTVKNLTVKISKYLKSKIGIK
ncbi:MAG: geranylgeranyl reductase family protein [Firmicutes bacterium]|nr:geranylgeranyl reductase family protein [Bacillota bacterium]